jgi:DNA-binding NarL/FixJ family response regulator
MSGLSPMLRTVIVDVQPLVLTLLSRALIRSGRFTVVTTSPSLSAVHAVLAGRDKVDLVLLSAAIPPAELLDGVAANAARDRKVVVYGEHNLDERFVSKLLLAGSSGVLAARMPAVRLVRAISNLAEAHYTHVDAEQLQARQLSKRS